jgi:hypothetical protein
MLSQNSLWGTQESHTEPHNSWCSSHNLNHVPLNTSQLHYSLIHLIKFTNTNHVVTSFFLRVKLKKKYTQKSKYNGVQQNNLTILQNSCEWNRWVLERSSSKTQSISVAMEHCSVEHQAFAVETYLKKKNDSVLTQKIFHRHFNINRNECL